MGEHTPGLGRRGNYSAAIAPAVGRTAPEPTIRGLPRPGGRRAGNLLGVLILIAATAAAYNYTVRSLVEAPGAPLACLGLALASMLVRTARPGPDINDRYTDLIVALPPLALALAILLLVPAHLSVFTWLWRLDLLSLPLFAAGAIALLYGVRVLWAQRLAVAILTLPWWLAITGLSGSPIVTGLCVGLVVLAAALAALRMRGRLAASPAPRAGWISVGLLALLMIVAAIANAGLERFHPLFDSTGQPIVRADTAPTLAGWTWRRQADYPWIRRYLNASATWHRYGYNPTDLEQPVMLVDEITSRDLSALSGPGLDAFYRLHGDRLLANRSVTMRDGVIGHFAEYADPSTGSPWSALYWDWPLRQGAYQRVVVSAAGSRSVSEPQLEAFANRLIDAAAR